MVGETETVIIAQKLSDDYLAAHSALKLLAAEAQRANGNAKTHQEYRDKALVQVERVNVEIAKFLETGRADDMLFGALTRSRDGFQKQAHSHWDQEIAALKLASKELNIFLTKALDIVAPSSETGTKLLVAIRREMGQATDVERLLRSFRAQRDRTFQHVRKMVEIIDQHLRAEEEAQKKE
jgi:hypothetical protein